MKEIREAFAELNVRDWIMACSGLATAFLFTALLIICLGG